MGKDAMACGIGPERLLLSKFMNVKEGVLLNKFGGIWPLKKFLPREIFVRLCICIIISRGILPESWLEARIRILSLVRFPKAVGMEFDRLFPIRPRDLRRRSLPSSAGIGPVRLVFVRLRTERKERLPR
jgi:hypothetical protein